MDLRKAPWSDRPGLLRGRGINELYRHVPLPSTLRFALTTEGLRNGTLPTSPAAPTRETRYEQLRYTIGLRRLLEIIHEAAHAIRRIGVLLKPLVARVGAVLLASLARREDRGQCDLVAALYDRPSICDHPTRVNENDPRNWFQMLLRPRNECVHRVRFVGLRPKNDNVREHAEGIPAHRRNHKSFVRE